MVYKFLYKKTGLGVSVNEDLGEESHKPVIKKFKRRIYARFKGRFWVADLAEMGFLCSFNHGEKNIFVSWFFN